jgi:cell division protein FtsB
MVTTTNPEKIIAKKSSNRQNAALVKKIEKLTSQIKALQDKLNEDACAAPEACEC